MVIRRPGWRTPRHKDLAEVKLTERRFVRNVRGLVPNGRKRLVDSIPGGRYIPVMTDSSESSLEVATRPPKSRAVTRARAGEQPQPRHRGVRPVPGRYYTERIASDQISDRRYSKQWRRLYRKRLIIGDAVAIFIAVAAAQFIRFGFPAGNAWVGTATYSLVLACTWLLAVGLQQSWDVDIVGSGPEEYRRVILATLWVFGAIAATALIFQLYPYVTRGYLLIALPLGLTSLLLIRKSLRRGIARMRMDGECTIRVVVSGQPQSIAAFADCIERNRSCGYSIVGACVPGFSPEFGSTITTLAGPIAVLGDEADVEDALTSTGADALAVAASDRLGHDHMRRLTWRLDALNVDLIVVPGMTDIAGPRLKIRQIDNLPLFHIARPRHDRGARVQKRTIDIVLGSLALICVLPLMLICAIAIKLDDAGPVFFRQERVGYRGRPFRIFKFRTMTVGSDERKADEVEFQGQSNVIFYKSADDSRITRVGRILRRTSVDEIPQLLNVLAGSMSLVGPRPLVPGEGASVEDFLERRSLIKPGMTGLWQVSGRSDVTAEERIRLDHSYVDNWSSVLDFIIMFRTVRAISKRDGAY